MAEHSEDFGQMGQTCVECSPCWPHRGGYGRCPCDCHPADPIADLEHAMAVIDRLSDENERLRAVVQAEIDQHFKVQDKHGQENAGPPYCAADSFLWPCPVRRRLESALDRKDTA